MRYMCVPVLVCVGSALLENRSYSPWVDPLRFTQDTWWDFTPKGEDSRVWTACAGTLKVAKDSETLFFY